MGIFRRNGDDDEIDHAFQQVLEILRRRLEQIEIEEETSHKEPEIPSRGEDRPLLDPLQIVESLNPVGKELEKLEKTLDKVRPKMESISRLVPRLNEVKALLEKDVQTRKKKIAEIPALTQNLEKQKKTIREDIDRKNRSMEELRMQIKQEEEKIAHIDLEVPKLQAEKQTNEGIVAQEDEGINKVNGNINRILNLQNLSGNKPY
jgi:chromosome segregation ATPase